MYHLNKIIAVAFIILLTGCSIGGEKKIKIFSVEQPREKLKDADREIVYKNGNGH